LAAWFSGAPSLTAEQRRLVETEEAWTLGVTAPQQKAALAPTLTLPRARGREECCDSDGRVGAAAQLPVKKYTYLRDPAEIYRGSLAAIRAEADLAGSPAALRPLALRLAHAAGDVAILDDIVWSRGAMQGGMRALAAGTPILVDAEMVAAGIIHHRLPAQN